MSLEGKYDTVYICIICIYPLAGVKDFLWKEVDTLNNGRDIFSTRFYPLYFSVEIRTPTMRSNFARARLNVLTSVV